MTEREASIGKLASVDFDAATGRLVGIRVTSRGILSGFLADELFVAKSAIIEMTKERVIIKDTAIPAEARSIAKQPTASPEPLLKEQET